MDLQEGEHYRVSVRHAFDGKLIALTQDTDGRDIAIFSTDSAAGVPHASSGTRSLPIENITATPIPDEE